MVETPIDHEANAITATEALRRNLMLIKASAFGVCHEGGGDNEHLKLFLAIGGAADEALMQLDLVIHPNMIASSG